MKKISKESLKVKNYIIIEKVKRKLIMQDKIVNICVWAMALCMVVCLAIIIGVGLEILKLPEPFLKYLIIPVCAPIAAVFKALFKK